MRTANLDAGMRDFYREPTKFLGTPIPLGVTPSLFTIVKNALVCPETPSIKAIYDPANPRLITHFEVDHANQHGYNVAISVRKQFDNSANPLSLDTSNSGTKGMLNWNGWSVDEIMEMINTPGKLYKDKVDVELLPKEDMFIFNRDGYCILVFGKTKEVKSTHGDYDLCYTPYWTTELPYMRKGKKTQEKPNLCLQWLNPTNIAVQMTYYQYSLNRQMYPYPEGFDPYYRLTAWDFDYEKQQAGDIRELSPTHFPPERDNPGWYYLTAKFEHRS